MISLVKTKILRAVTTEIWLSARLGPAAEGSFGLAPAAGRVSTVAVVVCVETTMCGLKVATRLGSLASVGRGWVAVAALVVSAASGFVCATPTELVDTMAIGIGIAALAGK